MAKFQHHRYRSRPAWGAWIEIDSQLLFDEVKKSRPAWGAWIEISKAFLLSSVLASRPAWGAWIEICIAMEHRPEGGRRAPHGARGLKLRAAANSAGLCGRAPHGARGLKYDDLCGHHRILLSRPAWGAWIEIFCGKDTRNTLSVAPRMGRVD